MIKTLLLNVNFIEMTIPEPPWSKNQKYLLLRRREMACRISKGKSELSPPFRSIIIPGDLVALRRWGTSFSKQITYLTFLNHI